MGIKSIIDKIGSWSNSFQDELTRLEEGLLKRVDTLQSSLYDEFSVLLDWLHFDKGALKNDPKNLRNLRKLEGVWGKFEKGSMSDELQVFAKELVGIGNKTFDYYSTTAGASQGAFDGVLASIKEVIGIDGKTLISGGYLDRLGKTAEVRQDLRDYVLQSIVNKRKLTDFQTGLKDLIVGNKDTDGALQRYYMQYATDAYNQVHEVANKSMADKMGMTYFIYQGSIIPTSRRFCVKRAGQVFSVDETKTWKDDPDLIDQKTKDQYNPLIERGRYNCRHFLNYISDEVAQTIRPDLKQ